MNHKSLVFLDVETTGLNCNTDAIVEIATIHVCVSQGKIYETHRHHAVFPWPEGVDVWQPHLDNGLYEACKLSVAHISHVDSVIANTVDEGTCIAGYTCHFDLGFVNAYMPLLAKRLHYRVINVSTLRDMSHMFGGTPRQSSSLHRAMPDCESALQDFVRYATLFS